MENSVYTFHSDPGHGWLEVPDADIIALNIWDKISKCSYIRGNTCYLEEDCDATKFFNAYVEKFGKEPAYNNSNHNNYCFIRRLHHFC